MAKSNLAEAYDVLAQLKASPVLFARHVLNADPTPQQITALEAIALPGAHVSIRSGHGTGKTALLAMIILWFLSTHSESVIPCTATTGSQLHDVLWAEIARWHGKMIAEFRNQLILNAEKLSVVGAEKTEFAVPRTARKENPEALQGFHSKNILFVIDEASGVDDSIFQVAEGALSGPGARVIMASNPTRTQGYFYDSHHKSRKHWVPLQFSCLDSPLVTEVYADQMRDKYGEHSNIYRVRVLGDFPNQEADQFIPLEVLEAAAVREVVGEGPVVWGMDPAHLGNDESALCKRQGNKIFEVKGTRGLDTMQLTGWLVNEIENTPKLMRPAHIFVDSIGIGAGVCDRLRELGYPVIGVNVSESPASKGKYINLRSELWAKFRDWLTDRTGSIPADDELIGQASAIKYDFDSSGRLKVESKKDMRRRGIVSPDRADAVMMTFYLKPSVDKAFTDAYAPPKRRGSWMSV